MTIRYECPECSSVLKIKPEKAGQQGKCPKCSFEFTIPKESPKREPVLTADDLVDMPLEVTPVAVIPRQTDTASDEFDPMGVLNSDSADGVSAMADPGELRPSVADLMKEHQEKRAREEARRNKRQQQQKKINPLLSELETSGTAADAITRSYERKRDDTTETTPLSREERRAAENRAAFRRWVLRSSGAAIVVVAFATALFTFVLRGTTADVVAVTGKVTAPGQSLKGYRIQFSPIQEINGPPLEGGPSAGKIRGNGEFTLMYKPDVPGAIVGRHKIKLEDKFGIEYVLPDDFTEREVTADGDNYFEFNF